MTCHVIVPVPPGSGAGGGRAGAARLAAGARPGRRTGPARGLPPEARAGPAR